METSKQVLVPVYVGESFLSKKNENIKKIVGFVSGVDGRMKSEPVSFILDEKFYAAFDRAYGSPTPDGVRSVILVRELTPLDNGGTAAVLKTVETGSLYSVVPLKK